MTKNKPVYNTGLGFKVTENFDHLVIYMKIRLEPDRLPNYINGNSPSSNQILGQPALERADQSAGAKLPPG